MCEYEVSASMCSCFGRRKTKKKKKGKNLWKNIKCAVADTSTVHHFIGFILLLHIKYRLCSGLVMFKRYVLQVAQKLFWIHQKLNGILIEKYARNIIWGGQSWGNATCWRKTSTTNRVGQGIIFQAITIAIRPNLMHKQCTVLVFITEKQPTKCCQVTQLCKQFFTISITETAF